MGRTIYFVGNDTTGDVVRIMREHGASAPAYIFGVDEVCGYWESRYELFLWACEKLGWLPQYCLLKDAFTGEILTNDELFDEDMESLETLALEYALANKR